MGTWVHSVRTGAATVVALLLTAPAAHAAGPASSAAITPRALEAAARHLATGGAPVVVPNAVRLPVSGGAPIAVSPVHLPARLPAPRLPAPPRSARRQAAVPDPPASPQPIAINIVVVIRVNSPGNDGPVLQVDTRRLGRRVQALSGLLRALGHADCASASATHPTALRRCTTALTGAARRALTANAPARHATRAVEPRRPLAPDRPGWRTPVSFTPSHAVPVRAASAPRPAGRVPHHRRAAPQTASAPAPVIPFVDLLPIAPGRSALAAPGGAGPGGVAIGLVTLLLLSLILQPLGRRIRLRRPLRGALLGTRLERPG